MPDDTIPDGTPEAGDDVTVPEPAVTAAIPTAGPSDDDATGVMAPTTTDGESADDATGVMAPVDAGAAEPAEPDKTGPRQAKRPLSRPWVTAIVAAVVVLAGAGVALAVTSGGKKKPNAPKHPRSSAAPVVTVPSGPVCPLTGQSAPGGQVPQRPALAIKVDNYPAARPQSGLNDADIVFEEPVEGGITRFVAVFQCQPASLVGPIRSARAVDAPILDQLSKPLFVHAGGIDPVIALVNEANLINDDVFTHASIVQHPSGRVAPYDTYTSTSAAWGLDPGDTTPPTPLFTYSAATPAGTPAAAVKIDFSGTNDNSWNWSAFDNAWLLSIGGVPANVASGARIGVANVVVQSVHVTYGPWLENSEGGLEVQSQLTGSGPLEVFRNGEEISGTWQRASVSDPTQLVAANGTTIALAPGRTWVELVPSTIPIVTSAPAPTPTTVPRAGGTS